MSEQANGPAGAPAPPEMIADVGGQSAGEVATSGAPSAAPNAAHDAAHSGSHSGSHNGNGAGPKRFLTRAEIFATQDIRREIVDVPEWGGSVHVKSLTAAQRDALEASCMIPDPATGNKRQKFSTLQFRAKLVQRTACDETGALIFNEFDVPSLGDKAAAAVNRIAEVAMRLSKISDDDVEEIVKNSESARSDGSTSDSASNNSGAFPSK